LKILPEIETIIPKHFALVEKKISPLYAFMQGTLNVYLDPQKIDFDEDIVYLISQMINKTKFVSEYQS
jgi:importin-8